jgi:hypothetical protein
MNQGESIAMWSLYNSGSEGVAVQTTVGQLKVALRHDPRITLIGRVTYLDYERDTMINSLNTISPLMHKRRSFQHEAEVRALILFTQMPNAPESKLTRQLESLEHIQSGRRTWRLHSRRSVRSHKQDCGFPQISCLGHPVLQEVVFGSGLKLYVEQSDLVKQPPAYKSSPKIQANPTSP